MHDEFYSKEDQGVKIRVTRKTWNKITPCLNKWTTSIAPVAKDSGGYFASVWTDKFIGSAQISDHTNAGSWIEK